MGDMADDFRALREHRKEVNAGRVDAFVDQVIPQLEAEGFHVRQLEPHHYRVNNRLDLYPVHRRFHYHSDPTNRKGKRGHYTDALTICKAFLNKPSLTRRMVSS